MTKEYCWKTRVFRPLQALCDGVSLLLSLLASIASRKHSHLLVVLFVT